MLPAVPILQRKRYAWAMMLLLMSHCDAQAQALSFGKWLSDTLSPRARALESERETLTNQIGSLPPLEGRNTSQSLGCRVVVTSSATEPCWMQLDLGVEQPIDMVALVPAALNTTPAGGPGYGFPVRFRVKLSPQEDFRNAKTLTDYSGEDFPNPGKYPVVLHASGRWIRYVRIECLKHQAQEKDWVSALGELIVISGNLDLAIGKSVQVSHACENSAFWSPRFLVDGQSILGASVSGQPSPSYGYLSATEKNPAPSSPKWVQVDLGRSLAIQEVRLVPSNPGGQPGYGFPVRFQVAAAETSDSAQSSLIFDATDCDFPNPGANPLVIPAQDVNGRFVRVTVQRLGRVEQEQYAFALSELQVFMSHRSVAEGKPVTASDAADRPKWSPAALTDGCASQFRLSHPQPWLAGLERRGKLVAQLEALDKEAKIIQRTVLIRSGILTAAGAGLLGLGALGLSWRQRRTRQLQVSLLSARIARDLHDDLGSNLAGIALAAQIANRHADDPAGSRRALEEIERTARLTSSALRDMVWLLKPENSDLEELVLHMREVSSVMLKEYECTFTVSGPIRSQRLPLGFTRQVYLTFKEAIHNILKHSRARHVTMQVTVDRDQFTLVVQDDGVGFDPNSITAGEGLRNQRQRAQGMGGQVEIVSRPGAGTTVHFRLPFRDYVIAYGT